MTESEYLAFEASVPEKHEYFQGEIYAMGGASCAHGLLVGNTVRELGTQLRGKPCGVVPADLRVKVLPSGLYTYPDVVVACGEPEFEAPEDTLLNPTLIVEVLSEGTEKWDRGGKFEHYQRIGSLMAYLLISQKSPRLELFTRQADDRWLYQAEDRLDASVPLDVIGCRLKLADVYEKVTGLREATPPPES